MKSKTRTILLIMFLLGIFMGALDTGIVSPARTVIADSFSVSTSSSIWIITIYTLAYAVSMPIAGKLADKYGKKEIFTISVTLFGIGSLFCGLSDFFHSYNMLLISRVIEAIGGGGIMPIATAYIGDSFPIKKRGTALGLVGAVYGISTTLGPSVGSALLGIFGDKNWGILFFINIPICLFIVITSILIKHENIKTFHKKMDLLGSIFASLTILSLMYGLTNLKFYDFKNSIKSLDVYPYLIAFLIILPIFIIIEKKATDPIINLKYFTDKNIAITLFISFIVGAGMMGIIFIPQFGANTLKLPAGSGGYLVTIMAIFSGIAAPLGGRLIDKYSPKIMLFVGFFLSIIGCLGLAYYSNHFASIAPLMTGLILMGVGMGLTMGTPLNYLMQSYVDSKEVASAQSTLSLIRSIGVTVSPNILINFIADAGRTIPNKIQAVMPPMKIPGMPTSATSSMLNNNSSSMANSFQNADVTTIVTSLEKFSSSMIDKASPTIKHSLEISHHLSPKITPDMVVNNFKHDYLLSIENSKNLIQSTYQHALNVGFKELFIASAIIAFVGLLCTLLLSNKKAKTNP